RQRPARPRPHALVSIVTRRRPPPPHLPYTTLFRSIAIAGITITDERKGAVDFTSPYYKSGTRIGVPVDNTDITSMEDLDGKTVASRLGSAPPDYLAENVPGAKALPFEQLDQTYLAGEGGSAAALLYDAPTVAY